MLRQSCQRQASQAAAHATLLQGGCCALHGGRHCCTTVADIAIAAAATAAVATATTNTITTITATAAGAAATATS
jgi:hypothetical protein